uniref:Uncharacterized protein n=1 Tax=Amphimedon queenslandica TaxID=400682 RepID=A0A1X7UV00_AMPQE
FTPFVYNYVMCISPNTPPLGVISFWYVIGFYPLLLLLLLYVWITLYDKGYKCVVFITRPFHRCMARFWSMTGIEPSFTHSIASIYILCFTQLAATSFKILSVAPKNETLDLNSTDFFYDMKQDYFKGVHGAAGFFAILVLLFLIVLPTLYILLYPFKWFHKLLDCLHLRKQLLISLGDVFTGPYKNGTENTFDYRFMAGLYLLARIIILIYSAAGLECRIYVSSSDGINNTSCWTGGVQTPCATIDLAIQGTATLQYNCSSGILINLSPGTYTLDTTSLLEQQLLRNNVSIIGMRDGSRYEE